MAVPGVYYVYGTLQEVQYRRWIFAAYRWLIGNENKELRGEYSPLNILINKNAQELQYDLLKTGG